MSLKKTPISVILSIVCLFLSCSRVDADLPVVSISKAELKRFSQELWESDENRAKSGDIRIDLQGKAPKNNYEDNASEKLFSYVKESLLEKETYKKLASLFDNYDPDLRDADRDSSEDEREVDAFLDSVLEQTVFQKVYKFFKEKGHPYAQSAQEFRKQVRKLWFGRFSRTKVAKMNGIRDTSAFEHTFIGELNRRRISGMHNWVRYYYLEKDDEEKIDYRGHFDSLKEDIVVISYKWQGKNTKKIGGFFVGTSPEYELAVYTTCFLAKRGKSCPILVDGCPATLIAHAWRDGSDVFIDNIYPKIYENQGQCEK